MTTKLSPSRNVTPSQTTVRQRRPAAIATLARPNVMLLASSNIGFGKDVRKAEQCVPAGPVSGAMRHHHKDREQQREDDRSLIRQIQKPYVFSSIR